MGDSKTWWNYLFSNKIHINNESCKIDNYLAISIDFCLSSWQWQFLLNSPLDCKSVSVINKQKSV